MSRVVTREHVQTRSAASFEERGDIRRTGGPRLTGRPGFLWSVPAVLYFSVFALLPLVFAVYLSFTKYNGIRVAPPVFVGTANWERLFSDPGIAQSIGVTLALVVLAVVTQIPLGVLTGVWAAGRQRWRAVVVALYFIPLLMSTAAVSVLWGSLLDPNFGLPAALPWLFGDGNLLGRQWSAIAVIVFIYLWGASPLYTLIFQGAARGIPAVLYQAAQIDGAGRARQFFSITLPQLRNTIVTTTILIVVGTFTAFDIILILTRGGPSNGTAILPFYMYQQAFISFDLGYGSVIALVLVVLCAIVSLVMVRLTGYDKMDSSQEGI
ncbi:sugar ABC transporter permease [Herbiconiux sp. CPCC 205716]|uniref:Sugar ABC transporter permease n=1 Tax=Herbiconiux gentiana TaxID=2970912 RepID=A0ABT2GAB4_9MICO|nr:sugar ABC transporter permease [Herbiconiux gentiana]MCS5713137.1 sugar ABC transporter permease [Herbiconiux gentiana]